MEKAAVTAALPLAQTFTASPIVKPEPLLTRDDVAAYLQVSSRTVDRAVEKGWLPAIKLGPKKNAPLRFRLSAVDAAIERGGRR